MDKRILKWLYNVKVAIDEIDSYFINEKRISLNIKRIL